MRSPAQVSRGLSELQGSGAFFPEEMWDTSGRRRWGVGDAAGQPAGPEGFAFTRAERGCRRRAASGAVAVARGRSPLRAVVSLSPYPEQFFVWERLRQASGLSLRL